MIKFLTTCGTGFIGPALIRYVIKNYDWFLVNVDKLTYTGGYDSLSDICHSDHYRFYQKGICNAKYMDEIFYESQPEVLYGLLNGIYNQSSPVDLYDNSELNINNSVKAIKPLFA
jgi:dTDP-glucose 4,6-dehydratase